MIGVNLLEITMSLDRSVAALNVGVPQPLGEEGEGLHNWLFGIVDEIRLHRAPLLLSSGKRLFDHIGPERLAVEKTRVIESPVATHLTFRVNNRPARDSAGRDQTASS